MFVHIKFIIPLSWVSATSLEGSLWKERGAFQMLNRQAFIGQDGRALPQMTCVESVQARTGLAGALPFFLKPEGTFAANSETRMICMSAGFCGTVSPHSGFWYSSLFRSMPPLHAYPPLLDKIGWGRGILTALASHPVCWSVLGIVILIGDYLSGPTIQFPILYLIPVILASWYSGYGWGLSFAVTMPLVRVMFYLISWPVPLTVSDTAINTLIRVLVLGGAAYLVRRTAAQTRELATRINVLEGILPICSFCHKIRDQHDTWQPLERYISDRSHARFSHGFCPECGTRHYGDFLKNK
jgi:hypothetical protein